MCCSFHPSWPDFIDHLSDYPSRGSTTLQTWFGVIMWSGLTWSKWKFIEVLLQLKFIYPGGFQRFSLGIYKVFEIPMKFKILAADSKKFKAYYSLNYQRYDLDFNLTIYFLYIIDLISSKLLAEQSIYKINYIR